MSANRTATIGRFEFDYDAKVLRRDGTDVGIAQGQELRLFELLLERRGKVVSYEDAKKELSVSKAGDKVLHGLVCSLRGKLGEQADICIENRPKSGYILVAQAPALEAAPPISQLFRGSYKVAIHLFADIYRANHSKMQARAAVLRKMLEDRLRPKPFRADVDVKVMPLDEARLVFKKAFERVAVTDGRLVDERNVDIARLVDNPFSPCRDLITLRCRCLDEGKVARMVDLLNGLWRAGTTVRSKPGRRRLEFQMEERLFLPDPNTQYPPTAVVDSFTVDVLTVDALREDLTEDDEPANVIWRPTDELNHASLRSYAIAALGAVAHGIARNAHEAWDSESLGVEASSLWMDHILDSARFASIQDLGEIDRLVRRGLPVALEYRARPDGRRTFAPGDVTDVLSKALLFSSERFFKTYPALAQTENFRQKFGAG